MRLLKSVLAVVIIFIASSSLFGQVDKIKEISNAEKFSDKSGTLIQKEFEDVGTIKKCQIKIARFTDLISNQKTNAVRFELEYVSTYAKESKIALLDFDEIDGFIKSLKLIQETVLPTNPINYTEISYRSRSGFEAGCFSGKGSWSIYMKLERYDGKSYVFMDKDDLPVLLSLLEKAKTKLL